MSPFGVDPFSTQPSVQTPTTSDPFSSTDPFADVPLDPFGARSTASNPFAFSSDVFGSSGQSAPRRDPLPKVSTGWIQLNE